MTPWPESCRELDVFSCHPNFQHLDASRVAAMHAAGIRVFPYNANTAAEIGQLAALEADGVIAKDPLLTRHWWALYG